MGKKKKIREVESDYRQSVNKKKITKMNREKWRCDTERIYITRELGEYAGKGLSGWLST